MTKSLDVFTIYDEICRIYDGPSSNSCRFSLVMVSPLLSQPGVTHHEWKQLSENAHLVIEENQLLTRQVQILKEKQSELVAEHHQKGEEGGANVAP